MDVSNIDVCKVAEAGAPVTLLHPGTEEELGITLMVRGYDSAEVKEALMKHDRTILNATEKPNPAEILDSRRRTQAKASLISVEGGSGQTRTVEDFRKLMDQPGFVWLIEQIEPVGGNRRPFFKTAGTTSASGPGNSAS
jgi:hypothetical protein